MKNIPSRGGPLLALRAGRNGYQRWLVHCTPHFLFSFQKEKRKRAVHGPKEKRKYAPCGGRGTRGRARRASGFYACLLSAAWCGRGFWRLSNGPASLFAAAYLVQGESFQKMAASGALPLIWYALKKKSGRRGSPATTGVRQQKEELVHSVKDNPRSI